MQTRYGDLCWELGWAFCLTQLSTQGMSLTFKSVAMQAFMSYLRIIQDQGAMWSGKFQLPCSIRLRLHGLTSSDLGLMTWSPCELAFSPRSRAKLWMHNWHVLWWKANRGRNASTQMCAIKLPMLIYWHSTLFWIFITKIENTCCVILLLLLYE